MDLHFVRDYLAPPEVVWRALTDTAAVDPFGKVRAVMNDPHDPEMLARRGRR